MFCALNIELYHSSISAIAKYYEICDFSDVISFRDILLFALVMNAVLASLWFTERILFYSFVF